MRSEWNGFVGGKWESEVNVRDFIQKNYTEYLGNEDFLEGTTEATDKLWGKVSEYYKEQRAKGGVLDMDTEGKLRPLIKARGKKNAMETIIQKMKEHAQGGTAYSGKCFISQSAFRQDAELLAEMIGNEFPALKGNIIINDIGTVIGSHTGPGTIALFFKGDMRR